VCVRRGGMNRITDLFLEFRISSGEFSVFWRKNAATAATTPGE
jgi:hypothetical protein